LKLEQIIRLEKYPITNHDFRQKSREILSDGGVLVLPGFLKPSALDSIHAEGVTGLGKAYFKTQRHNVYLTPNDPHYPETHVYNRQITSSKGCITDDQVEADSALRILYDSKKFKNYLSYVLGETALYHYADHLSSINLHYAKTGQELGWHFDNSSFAITLMIQPAEKGGQFEYVTGVRDADRNQENDEMNFSTVEAVLDGKVKPKQLSMDAGALVLFRGRNALHRVAPNEGDITRMLVVLAYNSEPGISLSESARNTFYGRLA
jgi:hypothetical protein